MRTLALLLLLALGVVGALFLLVRSSGGGGGVARTAPVAALAVEAGAPSDAGSESVGRSPLSTAREEPAPSSTAVLAERAPRTDSPRGTLLVQVVGPDSEPWPGVRVLLVEDGRLVVDVLAEAGAVELPRPLGAVQALALDPVAGAARADVEPGMEELVLSFDAPAAVAGRVHLAGAPPPEPLQLTLRTDLARAPESLPPPALRVWEELAPGGAQGATDAQGSFRFLVPRGWSGRLVLPGTMRLVDGGGSLTLDSPREGLLLELVVVPTIRGRVIEADGGAPVPEAWVMAFIEGKGFVGHNLRTDAGGRFEVPFDPESTRAATLDMRGPEQQGTRRLRLEPVPHSGVDLGDVELESGLELAVRVVDAAGEPIPGAGVGWGWGGAGPRTDAEGRALLRRGETPATRVSAHAPGFQVAVQRIAPDERGPLDLVLERCACLVLELGTADGGPLPQAVAVRVSARLGSFGEQESLERATGWSLMTNHRAYHRHEEAGSTVLRVWPKDPGELRIDCLDPGSPLALSVVDVLGETLIDLGEVTLLPTEERHLEVALEMRSRSSSVRVLDQDGVPLRGASVTLLGPRGRIRQETGDDGQAVIRGIHLERVDVWISASGHAPTLVRAVELPEVGAELEVALGLGRSLEVELVDAAGAPLEGAKVQASLRLLDGREGVVGEPTPLGPGRMLLELLPHEALHLRATHESSQGDTQAPANTERVRIELRR